MSYGCYRCGFFSRPPSLQRSGRQSTVGLVDFGAAVAKVYLRSLECHEESLPGTEAFLLGQEGNSGVGFIARYGKKKMVSLKLFVVACKILRHLELYTASPDVLVYNAMHGAQIAFTCIIIIY